MSIYVQAYSNQSLTWTGETICRLLTFNKFERTIDNTDNQEGEYGIFTSHQYHQHQANHWIPWTQDCEGFPDEQQWG